MFLQYLDKNSLDHIEKNYQFYIFLFSLLVLGMGLCRLYGRRTWSQWEKSRRKEARLPVASLISQDTAQSWRYSDLYESGLWGAGLMGLYALSNAVWPILLRIPVLHEILPVLFPTLHESVVADVYNSIRSTIFGAIMLILISIKQAGGIKFIMRRSPG